MMTKEKYDLIVKLLKEGRTNREICKIARCSPNEITPIRKTLYGETTGTSIDMKGKSICAQVFDLLEKGIPLAQIVIILDIDPEEAMRIQDKYLQLSKMDKILHFIKDQNDMDLDLTIEILQSLLVNPDDFDEIKEVKDLLTLKWKLINDRDELEIKIKYNAMLLKCYEEKLKKKRKQFVLQGNY